MGSTAGFLPGSSCPHATDTILARPGFAVGDVRSGSTKRVAAAVGEGSAAVRSVHAYLALDRHA
jgi:thioredoxin reductase (NADPH)